MALATHAPQSSLLAASGWTTKDTDQPGQVKGTVKAPSAAAAIRQLTTNHNLGLGVDFKPVFH